VAWAPGRTGTGYVFRVDAEGDQLRYDLSDVFDFIPRARLTEIRRTRDGLGLVIGCPCHADAFEYRPDILVIDIKDGAAPEDSPFERPLDERDDGSAGGEQSETAGPGLGGVIPARSSRPAGAAPSAAATSETGFLFERMLPGAPAPTPLPDADALRAELAQGLGRALSNGLLNAAPGRASDPSGPRRRPAQSLGLTLRTGMLDKPGAADSGAGERACLAPELFDVAGWGSAGRPHQQLAAARLRFVGEMEEAGADAPLELARAFVHLGFGAEAQRVLDAYGAGTPAEAVAAAIGRVIDSPAEGRERLLISQATCGGPAAIWALLASSAEAGPPPEVDPAPVLRTLGVLPLHLRRHLVPHVSERLRAMGHDAEAASARATLTRATPDPGPALVVETARGNPAGDEIVGDLTEAARKQSEAALAARAGLLQRRAREAAPVGPDLRHEVEAQIHASKGTRASDQLTGAYVMALTENGAHEEALALLERLARSEFAGSYDLAAHADRLAESLAETSQPGRFVALARDMAVGPLMDHLTPPSARTVATRLQRAGFIELAAPFDRRAGIGDAARRRALAKGALVSARPEEALVRLRGLTDSEALRLRASALEKLGAHGEAAQIYAGLGESEAAGLALWRAGRWDEAASFLSVGTRRRLGDEFGADAASSPQARIDRITPQAQTSTASPSAGTAVLRQPGPRTDSGSDIDASTPPPITARTPGTGSPDEGGEGDAAAVTASDPADTDPAGGARTAPSRSAAAMLLQQSEELRTLVNDLLASPPAGAQP